MNDSVKKMKGWKENKRRRWTDKPHIGKKNLQITFPTKDLYWEFKKNSVNKLNSKQIKNPIRKQAKVFDTLPEIMQMETHENVFDWKMQIKTTKITKHS